MELMMRLFVFFYRRQEREHHLGNIILQYREVEASVSNFDKLMQKPIEQRPEDPVEIGHLHDLRFENVLFHHKMANYNAIDDISFSVKTGETIAFVGLSGSGKSTLVKLLLGLYKPVTVAIYFNDQLSTDIRYNQLPQANWFCYPRHPFVCRYH